jgi:hypothetical protein
LVYNTYIHGNVKKLPVQLSLTTKMSLFSFTKLENRQAEQVLSWGGNSGRGKDVEKSYRRANIVHILCTQVCKWKSKTC